MTPGMDNLHIITSGAIPPNPADLVGSQHMDQFIEEAREVYDIVILDSTPILSAADAAILGRKVDGALLVYRVGLVSRGLLKRSTTQLEQVNCNIIGVVLNGMKPEISPDFQDYKHYSYYYSYGRSEEDKKDKGYKKGLTYLSKKRNGQETKKTKDETGGGGAGTPDKPMKKLNKMNLLFLLLSLVLLAGGLLWQNGVVDPFALIQSVLPKINPQMNGSPKEIRARDNSKRKPVTVRESTKGKATKKEKMTPNRTAPNKKPAVNRVAEPSRQVSPKTIEIPKSATPNKQVATPNQSRSEASRKKLVVRKQIPTPENPTIEKKTRDPFSEPLKVLSPKAKKIDKETSPKKPLVISKTRKIGMDGKKPALTGNDSVTKVSAYHPYSLYIGSFRTVERANKAVAIYTSKGLRSAYKVKVFLSKGVWYRVYLGYFESYEGADKFRLENGLKETTVKKTPYANLIGTYSSTSTLENKIESLKKLGFSPYVITDQGGKYRLFVGAFHPKSRAETQHEELKSKGISNRIVKR